MPRKPQAASEEAAPFTVATATVQAPVAPLKSPAERAVLALNSSERETALVELVKKSADIVEVKNPDARAQVHRMAMDLKNARVEIEKEAKAARDDATKFSKAVIAEEGRLITITSAEEDRLFKLRDDFDTEQARIEKEAKERNEARIAAIQSKIYAITALPREHAAADSTTLKAVLQQLATREATKEEFAELIDEAAVAIETTASALIALFNGAVEREQAEAERLRKAEEERQRIAAQAEANRVESERLAAEKLASERAAQEVAQAAAQLSVAQEQQKRTIQAVSELQALGATESDALELDDAIVTAGAWKIDAEHYGAGAAMVTMARDMAIKTLTNRLAQAVALEIDDAHAEALELNARFDQLRESAKDASSGVHYSMSTIKENGDPILLNADGSRSVFCDLDEGGEPEAAPAPEPTPLPLPESYSPVDELIDAALSQGPSDFDAVEAFQDAVRDLLNTRSGDQIRALLEQTLEAVEA